MENTSSGGTFTLAENEQEQTSADCSLPIQPAHVADTGTGSSSMSATTFTTISENLSNLSFDTESESEQPQALPGPVSDNTDPIIEENPTTAVESLLKRTPPKPSKIPIKIATRNVFEDNENSVAQIFNATSTSLNNLLVYGGDSDADDDGDDGPIIIRANNDDSDSFDCDTADETPDIKMDQKSQSQSSVESAVPSKKKKHDSLQETLKHLGELSIEDLPPVPVAMAEVRADECDQIGKVSSIIDKLVMVESIPNKPAYDIDTLLFLENGKQPLGYIFDVIGPVTNPMYAIRFNSIQDITASNVKVGMPVYSAPKTEHSHYVFVQHLLKQKGSDASWTNDLEVPSEFQDFSDDEAEYYLGVNADNRKRSSVDRHKDFEKDMNVRNLIDSRLHRVRDNSEAKNKRPNTHHAPPRTSLVSVGHQPRQMRPTFQNATPCAFPPPYSLPPYMPAMPAMNPYVPQFVPRLPPPLPMQFSAPPRPPAHMPPQQPPPSNLFGNLPMAPPSASQAKPPVQGPMLYPPDMGLPPATQNPNLVPNLQFYNPQVMWNNFASQPPQPRAAAGAQNDMHPRKKYFKMRRK